MHGLWQAQTRRGARLAWRADVPYLIAAHGMAEPWAMRHKAWKKKVYTALVEGKNLRRAACLHACRAPRSATSARSRLGRPICFVPNGVDLGPFDDLPDRVVPRGGIPRAGGQVRPALLRPDPRQEGARPARRGVRPDPTRSSASPSPPRRQRRRGARAVPEPDRRRRADRRG